MSIGVAFGNKVMDTRLPLPVGSGDKYDVSGFGLKYLLCTFCKSTKYPSPEANASTSPSGGEVLNDDRKCLKDITLIEINNICKACDKGKQAYTLVLDM